jgi:hypothetical protein
MQQLEDRGGRLQGEPLTIAWRYSETRAKSGATNSLMISWSRSVAEAALVSDPQRAIPTPKRVAQITSFWSVTRRLIATLQSRHRFFTNERHRWRFHVPKTLWDRAAKRLNLLYKGRRRLRGIGGGMPPGESPPSQQCSHELCHQATTLPPTHFQLRTSASMAHGAIRAAQWEYGSFRRIVKARYSCSAKTRRARRCGSVMGERDSCTSARFETSAGSP